MKNTLLLLIVWQLPILILGQDLALTRTIVLQQDSLTIKADIFVNSVQIQTKNKLLYCSYYNEGIQQTQGAYSGHLVHGRYGIYLSNNSIKELGYFYYGLKHGEWKVWYLNGQLKVLDYWIHGRKDGSSEYYNIDGRLIKKGKYKNDLKEGKWYYYEQDSLKMVEVYKKGILKESIHYQNGERLKPEAIDSTTMVVASNQKDSTLNYKKEKKWKKSERNQYPNRRSTSLLIYLQ